MITEARIQALADILATWRDPEFWGSEGLGCAHCHVNEPMVFGLPFGALCWDCLALCFLGWDADRLIQWLGYQKQSYIRQGERKAALAAANKGNINEALEYERKYGVWLLQMPRP